MKKKKTYIDYKKIFDEFLASGEPVTTRDKTQTLQIDKNTRWKQCYDPDHNIRKHYPEYWFVSEDGKLISISGNKAYLNKPDFSTFGGRPTYRINLKNPDGTSDSRRIKAYNLVNLVFGGSVYGEKAEEILRKEGLSAFTREKGKPSLVGHHIDNKPEHNNVENIEIMSTVIHDMVSHVPKGDDDRPNRIKDFLRRYATAATKEEPNKISVLQTGQAYDGESKEFIDDSGIRLIFGTQILYLTKEAADQLKLVQGEILNRNIVYNVIRDLFEIYDTEYFIEPKYFYLADKHYYKCQYIDEKFDVEEITDYSDLIGKDFIVCYINDEGDVEYLLDTEKN